MNGIIIAGGFGTRMRPLTYDRPKHLLPVANRPFLEYQVALLRRHGVADVVLATNYLAERIEQHFGDGSEFGVRMTYAREPEPLGTAGAIRNAATGAPAQSSIVLNGDILTDYDITELAEFHRARGADATIALRSVARPHPFGTLQVQPDGRVVEWREPSEEEKRRVAGSGPVESGEHDLINAGIYILEPAFIARIPSGRPVSIERETYPRQIAAGAVIFGCAPSGFWLDMGHPEQFLAANAAVAVGTLRTDVAGAAVAPGAHVADTAQVDERSCIGSGARVGPGSRIRGSVLLDGASVGANVDLEHVVVDEAARLGDCVRLGRVVVARGSALEMGTCSI